VVRILLPALVAITVVGVLVSGPSRSQAQARRVCVTQSAGPAPCGEDCPDGVFTSVSAAADALALLQNSTGPDTARLCVAFGHVEQVEVDNRDESIATSLNLTTEGPICLPPGTPSGTPAITFAPGTTGDLLIPRLAFGEGAAGLASDFVCDGPVGAGVKIEGSGSVVLGGDGWIVGYEGYGVDAVDVDKPSVTVQLRIFNGSGPAVRGNGRVIVHNTEISGNTVGGLGGEGLLAAVEDGSLSAFDVLFFGNLVLGGSAGSAVGLISGRGHGLSSLSFVGNGLVETPLLRTGFRGVVESQGGDLDEQKPRFSNLVFSRNRALAAESAPSNSPSAGWVDRLEAVGERCLGDTPEQPSHGRGAPFAGYPSGDAPMISVNTSDWQPGIAEANIYRTWFIGNTTGDAPLVEFDFGGVDLHGSVLHSLFVDNDSGGAIALSDSRGDGTFTAVRNLALDSGVFTAIGGDGLGTLELTMNVGTTDTAWVEGQTAAPLSILGPNQEQSASVPVWEDASVIRQLAPRLQFERVAPGATTAEEAEQGMAGRWLCAPDRAAEFLPVATTIDDWWLHWPWGTSFFVDQEPGARPGPSGGPVFLPNGPLDTSRDGRWGDGDGFSHAIDCDNDDPGVVPRLPDLDGFTTNECYERLDTCWQCPPGSTLVDPPEGDDDAVDDDDAEDEDDSDVVPDDSTGNSALEQSCGCSGCGVHYSCDDLAAVGLLPIATLWTRRRRRAPWSGSNQ